MKKILVPIDFSECADNALNYAIQLAKATKFNLHICHSIVPIANNAMYGITVITPSEEESYIERTTKFLKTFAEKIIEKENLNTAETPSLTYSIEHVNANEAIDQLINRHDFDLIVMGLSGAGAVEKFLVGSTSRKQIDQTKIPTLLIPKSARYRKVNKIAFATDLNVGDMNSIQNIARQFCRFEPEILLCHIHGLPSDFHDPYSKANIFLKNVTGKINYSKIYYRHIQQKNVNDGLLWLTQKGDVDILAMVHRQKGMFAEFAFGSHTQHMAKTISIPLMVLPEGNEIIGW